MQQEFQQIIQDDFSFLYNTKIIIAISGGVDSVVLAHLCKIENLNFALAHCNFQLRGKESDEDEQFIKELASEIKAPFYIKRFKTKALVNKDQSIQLKARELRYEWFNELCSKKEFNYVLTAHHLNDDIETFFINLIRGTGLEGLSGIPSQNENILRPLLKFTKTQLLSYALDNNLKWSEDQTNETDDYLRNRIRHHVIPFLEKENSNFTSAFKSTQNNLQETSTLLNDYRNLVENDVVSKTSGKCFYNIKKLKTLPHTKAVLYQLFVKYGFKAWRDINDLLDAQPGKQVFSNTHCLLRDRESLILFEREEDSKNEEFLLEKDGRKLKFSEGQLICEIVPKITDRAKTTAYLAAEKLGYPLKLRRWQAGDVFQPFGMKGHKKVSDFLQDEKVSLFEKENVWVLISDKTIVWVVGHRIHHEFRIKEDTVSILKIKLLE